MHPRRLALVALLALPVSLAAATVVLPHTFSNGTVADADAVNANFSTLATEVSLHDGRLSAVEGAVTGSAGGDLQGNYPNPTVAKLQGFPVGTATPSANQVLRWNGSAWVPGTAASVDVYTRWGPSSCPTGDTAVYTGVAFGSIRGYYGSSEPLCMAANDPGAANNGQNHGSYLAPLATYFTGNDAVHQVPGVAKAQIIPCAVCETTRKCITVPGTHTCPATWTRISSTSAWLAGGYYANGPPLDSFCYEVNNAAAAAPAGLDQVFSAGTAAAQYMPSGYTGLRHMKCAVCCK